jgi:hypothetical protein
VELSPPAQAERKTVATARKRRIGGSARGANNLWSPGAGRQSLAAGVDPQNPHT